MLLVGHDRGCQLTFLFFFYIKLLVSHLLCSSLCSLSQASLCLVPVKVFLNWASKIVIQSLAAGTRVQKWRVFELRVLMGSCFSARVKAESLPCNGLFSNSYRSRWIFDFTLCQSWCFLFIPFFFISLAWKGIFSICLCFFPCWFWILDAFFLEISTTVWLIRKGRWIGDLQFWFLFLYLHYYFPVTETSSCCFSFMNITETFSSTTKEDHKNHPSSYVTLG